MLLPLAIFTLGTIVVQPSVATTQQIIAIPNGDSIHEDFSGPFTAANSNPTVFGGTLANGSLAFFSTLVQGEVVQILQDNYIANISYSIGFNGPALSPAPRRIMQQHFYESCLGII